MFKSQVLTLLHENQWWYNVDRDNIGFIIFPSQAVNGDQQGPNLVAESGSTGGGRGLSPWGLGMVCPYGGLEWFVLLGAGDGLSLWGLAVPRKAAAGEVVFCV